MKIVWTSLSIDKITEIADYIALDDLTASVKWVESFFKRVKQLERYPNSGRVVPEVLRPEIREIIYGNYRIIYKIMKDVISILTISHVKQILPEEDF